jgi:hypothetical protein
MMNGGHSSGVDFDAYSDGNEGVDGLGKTDGILATSVLHIKMRSYVYDLGIGSGRSHSAGFAAVMWAVMRRCGADIFFSIYCSGCIAQFTACQLIC